MEEDDDTQIENDIPRSLHSRIKSPIQFINCTGRRVNMIWMNYRGEQVLSTKLSVQSNVKVNTYVTHPWIAVDDDTSERLLLNFNDVFYPEEPTIRRVLNVRSHQVLAVRKEVLITVPVYRLEYYCKKEIRKLVSSENIRALPLPPVIINELLETTR